MKRSGSGITLAIVAGGVVAALCAAVLLLQVTGEPGRSEEVTPLAAPAPLPRRRAALPEVPAVAGLPDAPPLGRAPLQFERARVGPDAILGRVVDAETDTPVADFQVHILPAADGDPMERLREAEPEPFHHRDGVFKIPQPVGEYDVVVIAPGFQPSVLRDWVVPAADGRPVRVPLDRGPGISGTVIDTYSGQALAGVEVYLHVTRLNDPDAVIPQRRRAVTQHDGRYSFSPLPAGQYALSLIEPHNRVDYVSTVWVGTGTSLQDLYLLPRHTIVVYVHEIDGRLSPGARVSLRGSGAVRSATTDEQGVALLEFLLDGEYRVEARQEGFEPVSQELVLQNDSGQHVRHLYFDEFAD